MSPEMMNTIERVVNDCKVYQKFQKSIARPHVTLPKVSSFNEVVTLDLKEFGNKYVLWMIDSFSRFMVGKLISKKKADTIKGGRFREGYTGSGYGFLEFLAISTFCG